MKQFFESPTGSMLKTWLKTFVGACILAAVGLAQEGKFGFDMLTLQAVLLAGLLGVGAVIATWFDTSDTRYGRGADA